MSTLGKCEIWTLFIF